MKQTITINGINYPLIKTGSGPIQCLVIGNVTHALSGISNQVKKEFTFYGSDLYWSTSHKYVDPTRLTIKQMCEDAHSIAEQLHLTHYIVYGFSAFGLLAVEYAKERPEIAGVLMVSTPLRADQAMAKQAEAYFQAHASDERKLNEQQRLTHYQTIKKPDDTGVSINVYISHAARYWADYMISDQTIRHVWADFEYDTEIVNHFWGTLLPQLDSEKNIEAVNCPVLLVGGTYDFDCIPLITWPDSVIAKKLGPHFSMVACDQSGHWPQFEEPACFDKAVIEWIHDLNKERSQIPHSV